MAKLKKIKSPNYKNCQTVQRKKAESLLSKQNPWLTQVDSVKCSLKPATTWPFWTENVEVNQLFEKPVSSSTSKQCY